MPEEVKRKRERKSRGKEDKNCFHVVCSNWNEQWEAGLTQQEEIKDSETIRLSW